MESFMPRTKNIKRNIGFDPITDERVRKLALANYPRLSTKAYLGQKSSPPIRWTSMANGL